MTQRPLRRTWIETSTAWGRDLNHSRHNVLFGGRGLKLESELKRLGFWEDTTSSSEDVDWNLLIDDSIVSTKVDTTSSSEDVDWNRQTARWIYRMWQTQRPLRRTWIETSQLSLSSFIFYDTTSSSEDVDWNCPYTKHCLEPNGHNVLFGGRGLKLYCFCVQKLWQKTQRPLRRTWIETTCIFEIVTISLDTTSSSEDVDWNFLPSTGYAKSNWTQRPLRRTWIETG